MEGLGVANFHIMLEQLGLHIEHDDTTSWLESDSGNSGQRGPEIEDSLYTNAMLYQRTINVCLGL